MPSSPDLEAAVYAEIDPSGRTTSPATIEQVKDLYVRSKTSAPDELGYVAKMYGSALTTGRKARELKEWRDRIRKLTANRVTAVAAGYLVPDDSTTVSLLPNTENSRDREPIPRCVFTSFACFYSWEGNTPSATRLAIFFVVNFLLILPAVTTHTAMTGRYVEAASASHSRCPMSDNVGDAT
ncbi:hypothetical protein NKH71_26685 [Mesorhizobium sp. M0983]|uniref:hypothetical protein n=1 Tax=Mesorhizobium sp. M0983 TaxID=2957040 RepID=UPI00333AD54A